MNEDRRRFLQAFGMGFCVGGNHATDEAYLYQNVVYCPKHPPAPQPADPAVAGRCQWQLGHWAPAVWQVPRDGRYYCAQHLRRILDIGSWGWKR